MYLLFIYLFIYLSIYSSISIYFPFPLPFFHFLSLSTQPGGHVTARTEERAKRCYKKAERTGRAHNFFIASHPWDDAVGGKKLAGTRAGKQYYLAFDTELVIQSGCKLFRTDEAIIKQTRGMGWERAHRLRVATLEEGANLVNAGPQKTSWATLEILRIHVLFVIPVTFRFLVWTCGKVIFSGWQVGKLVNMGHWLR